MTRRGMSAFVPVLSLFMVTSAKAQDLSVYAGRDKIVKRSVLLFGYNQPVQVRVTSGFGSVDDTQQPFSPALICDDDIAHRFTLDCYQAWTQKDIYFDDPHVEFVNFADAHQAVIFSANINYSGSGWTWLWSLLVLDSHGIWQNMLPEVTSSNQSEHLFWHSPAQSSYGIFSVADFIWAEGETHFAAHRYRIKSYEYCASKSKYVLADDFVTKRKFPGLDDVDELDVIHPELPEIKAHLREKPSSACKPVTAAPD